MSVRHEFEVGPAPDIDVSVDSGRLLVVTGEAGRIVVDIDGRSDDWEIGQVGSAVTVRPARRWRTRSTRVHLVVPAGCRVVVRTATADVRLDGRFAATSVTTASGDIDVGPATGLQVSTASGELQADDVTGDVELSTISGDARLGAVSGRVGITTTSGTIRLGGVAGDLTANSVSGDIRIARFDGDDLAVKTVSGDLEVGLPSGIRVSPEISTFSGSTRLPERRSEVDADTPRRRVRVAFKSVSGDITIRRLER
jgi:DUF4097 and DUF4098 domain-containing protein YvlB